MRTNHLFSVLLVVVAAAGCPDAAPGVPDGGAPGGAVGADGGTPGGGTGDAGALDAGSDDVRADAGGVDGGARSDAGVLDGGVLDGGFVDAGLSIDDAGDADADDLDGGPAEAGLDDDAGVEGAGATIGFTPPPSAYVLLSPPADFQEEERDSLQANDLFVVEARVGHVEDLQSLGFTVRWDPGALVLVHKEPVADWLTSGGGNLVVLSEQEDAAEGDLFVALGVTGGPVSTSASEVVYRLTFDFAASPTSTVIDLDLGEDGLFQQGASGPLPDVVAVDLSVAP